MRLVAESFGLEFPEVGARSETWSFASGGFLELLTEDIPGSSGLSWFGQTPRVIGLGFASDAFAADTAWVDEDGAGR